jgi:hypothetical protein
MAAAMSELNINWFELAAKCFKKYGGTPAAAG